MTLDTSAVLAILKGEPEAAAFYRAIEDAEVLHISAASYLEASIVTDSYHDPKLSRRFDEFMEIPKLLIEPVTAEQARIARQAYRDYGKGSGHRAGLNFGDCFSYALARVQREPILFKGDDFLHTDLRPAV
jgi:ribonuclease VapC